MCNKKLKFKTGIWYKNHTHTHILGEKWNAARIHIQWRQTKKWVIKIAFIARETFIAYALLPCFCMVNTLYAMKCCLPKKFSPRPFKLKEPVHSAAPHHTALLFKRWWVKDESEKQSITIYYLEFLFKNGQLQVFLTTIEMKLLGAHLFIKL